MIAQYLPLWDFLGTEFLWRYGFVKRFVLDSILRAFTEIAQRPKHTKGTTTKDHARIVLARHAVCRYRFVEDRNKTALT